MEREEGDLEKVLETVDMLKVTVKHVTEPEATITVEEIKLAIKALKPNTIPGPDGYFTRYLRQTDFLT